MIAYYTEHGPGLKSQLCHFPEMSPGAEMHVFSEPHMLPHQKWPNRDFPGGAVVKSPPATAGDTGLSPGLGRSHMPRSN